MKKLKWLIWSQGIVLFGTGIVFPFYIIFIREVGANFTEFGIAYALFAISSALVHYLIGKSSDKRGRKVFLLLNSWGVAILFLLFPLATHILHVYLLQIALGVFGAMQKTCEKALLGDFTEKESRGSKIGAYHGWTTIFSGFAIIAGGFLIDLFTINIIFYIGSIILFFSGFAVLKIPEKQLSKK